MSVTVYNYTGLELVASSGTLTKVIPCGGYRSPTELKLVAGSVFSIKSTNTTKYMIPKNTVTFSGTLDKYLLIGVSNSAPVAPTDTPAVTVQEYDSTQKDKGIAFFDCVAGKIVSSQRFADKTVTTTGKQYAVALKSTLTKEMYKKSSDGIITKIIDVITKDTICDVDIFTGISLTKCNEGKGAAGTGESGIFSSLWFWIIVLFVIVAIVLAAGGAYYYHNKKKSG